MSSFVSLHVHVLVVVVAEGEELLDESQDRPPSAWQLKVRNQSIHTVPEQCACVHSSATRLGKHTPRAGMQNVLCQKGGCVKALKVSIRLHFSIQ